MLYKYLFSVLAYTYYQYNFILCAPVQERGMESLAQCILKISSLELKYKPTIVLQYNENFENCDKRNDNLFMQKLIELTTKGNNPRILQTLGQVNEKNVSNVTSWLMVLYLKNCEDLSLYDFTKIDDQIKYLVYVSEYEECYNDLEKLGLYVGKYDVTLILKSAHENFKFLTFIPKIDADCKEVTGTLTKINVCINGSTEHTTVFPDKNLSNLKKCAFNVGVGNLFPFATVKDNENITNYSKLDEERVQGADLEIIKIITKQLNGTLNLYYVPRRHGNPAKKNDFMFLFKNKSLDACIGGVYRIYGDTVAYSGIYIREAISWMYTVDRVSRTWQNLVMKVPGLYIFMIFYLSYCVIWYLFCKFDNQSVSMKNILLYSWGALVGAASLQDATTIKQKILNLTYLVMCIYLSAYINVQLFSYLTILEPPEILKGNDDVMESGREPYLITIAKYFVHDDKYTRFANTSKECVSFLDCIEQSVANKGVTVLLQGVFLDLQGKTSDNDEAKVLKPSENILTVYYEMVIRKDSPYVAKFQDIVKRLFEAGITEKLYMEAIGLSVIGKAKSGSDNIIKNSYSCHFGCKIAWNQIAGVFYLWFFGCGISICVFALENIVGRDTQRNNQLKY